MIGNYLTEFAVWLLDARHSAVKTKGGAKGCGKYLRSYGFHKSYIPSPIIIFRREITRGRREGRGGIIKMENILHITSFGEFLKVAQKGVYV